MTKKEIKNVQEYEAVLHRNMEINAEYYGLNHEQTRLYRAEWAGVYRVMEMSGIPVDYEIREKVK